MKQTKEKLEAELATLRTKCENLQSQLNKPGSSEEEKLRAMRASYEEQLSSLQASFDQKYEKLEEETANLKNKIVDLDRLVEEYENKYNTLKVQAQALEQQNKSLENELDRLGEQLRSSGGGGAVGIGSSIPASSNGINGGGSGRGSISGDNQKQTFSSEMHSHKIDALQQANRILEEEMIALKEQYRVERARLHEELMRLSERSSDTDMHGHKLEAVQQANRILEEELGALKELQRNERERLTETVNQLTERHEERIRQLENANRMLEQELHRLKFDEQQRLDPRLDQRLDPRLDSRQEERIKQLEETNRVLEQEVHRLRYEDHRLDPRQEERIKHLEETNRVLEQELHRLRYEDPRVLDPRLDQRMVDPRQEERIKQLEDANRLLEHELHRVHDQYTAASRDSIKYGEISANARYDVFGSGEDSSTLLLLKSQCDSLKKRIMELELYENTYRNLERDIERLKQELRDKDVYYAEEMKKFESGNKSFNELNAGYAHLNETMLTMSRKYEQDIHNFDSKLKNLQNMLEKKGKKSFLLFNYVIK
jgi:chromosome segregation ATPase